MSIEKYKITKMNTFLFELDNIIGYILYNLKEPNIAAKKYRKINERIDTLDRLPERCPKVFKNDNAVRKLIFDKYIVIYEIKKDTRSSNNPTHISFQSKLFKKIKSITS